ncbi:TPA: hypothetical protein ACH3X2_010561 [Trebouxia sp. C0005]
MGEMPIFHTVFYHFSLCQQTKRQGFAWQVIKKSYPGEVRQICPDSMSDAVLRWAQVEVQEAYGKQSPQRYPLDPPGSKSVTGEDTSTHNRGRKGPNGELAVLGLASADDKSSNALYISVSFGSLVIGCVDHLPEELMAVTIQGLSFSMAMGIDPEGTFRRMQLSLQIDDQLSASRFPVVLSPADIAEEALEYYPLLTLAVISQLASCSLAWLAARPSTPDFFPDFQDPAVEMGQRLDLTSLTAQQDEEHAEAAKEVPMQMSLVSISSLARQSQLLW